MDFGSPRSRPRGLLLGTLCLAAVVALSGCSKKSQSPASSGAGGTSASASSSSAVCQHVGSVSFDKTKLVLHAGLAFGAFHHFIYKPFKDGAFKSGTSGRIKALVKAGLAGAFTVHELGLVKADAESSPTLCHIVGPLDEAAAALNGVKDKLKAGDATAIDGVQSKLASAQHTASANGVQLSDRVPSGAQLANGG